MYTQKLETERHTMEQLANQHKLIKEKIYLQRQLASAINAMTDQQKRSAARMQELAEQINEQQSRAKVACQMDQERQNMEQILEASLQ